MSWEMGPCPNCGSTPQQGTDRVLCGNCGLLGPQNDFDGQKWGRMSARCQQQQIQVRRESIARDVLVATTRHIGCGTYDPAFVAKFAAECANELLRRLRDAY
jgi:hypothetical protein